MLENTGQSAQTYAAKSWVETLFQEKEECGKLKVFQGDNASELSSLINDNDIKTNESRAAETFWIPLSRLHDTFIATELESSSLFCVMKTRKPWTIRKT